MQVFKEETCNTCLMLQKQSQGEHTSTYTTDLWKQPSPACFSLLHAIVMSKFCLGVKPVMHLFMFQKALLISQKQPQMDPIFIQREKEIDYFLLLHLLAEIHNWSCCLSTNLGTNSSWWGNLQQERWYKGKGRNSLFSGNPLWLLCEIRGIFRNINSHLV